MLPESVKDPVGYLVTVVRSSDGGLCKGLVKAYNEHHNTLLIVFDDSEEGWFGVEDNIKFLQQSSPYSISIVTFPYVAAYRKRPAKDGFPKPDNPLFWKVRVSSGKKGLVTGYSAPLAQITLDTGESVYVNIDTHEISFLYCTTIFQFETTPRQTMPESEEPEPRQAPLPLFAKQFDVTDVRTKLQTYQLILEHCQSSPKWQTKIGSELKSIENDYRRIHFVFQDLQAGDRGLRLAAARCICALAYENDANQALLNQENGMTVQWLRVFSIPAKFKQHYEDDCRVECRLPDQEGFLRYLNAMIQANMSTVAATVYDFYNQTARLPRLWCFPAVEDSLHEWSSVPDPESHLIGYILTPRGAACLPKHLSTAEVHDIATLFTPNKPIMNILKKAQTIRASIASPVNRFLLYDSLNADPMLQPYLEDDAPMAGLLATFETTDNIAWRDLFCYFSARLHVESLGRDWGHTFVVEMLRLFVSLIPYRVSWIYHHSWVWQGRLREAMETSAPLNSIHSFFQALDETDAPIRLLAVLTRLRQMDVPHPPTTHCSPSSSSPRRKSKGDHRVSLAIASAQEAVRALTAIQAKNHADSHYKRHLSDVDHIKTYVSQTAQRLHDKVLQSAQTPLVLHPLCHNLDAIVTSITETKVHAQQEREQSVTTNKQRLEAAEKRHLDAAKAKQAKWQKQCETIETERKKLQEAAHERNAKKMGRVQDERHKIERRQQEELQQLEKRVSKIMQSPVHCDPKVVRKPHPPKQPVRPQPSTANAATTNVRPQSARIVRERSIAFGNMAAKLHTVEVQMKKEQTKAMWRHLHLEKKKFDHAPSVEKCVDLESSSIARTRRALEPPTKVATEFELPLANKAACAKLASELMPPAVKPPEIDDEGSSSYCVMAKYNRTLDEEQRQQFKERFASNHVKLNHRLSYAVQEQYVHMARRNQAWSAFCASSRIYSDDLEMLKRTEFATVARNVGIILHDAEYEAVCRRLDKHMTGFLAWRDFYEWFLDQDLKFAMGGSQTERRASADR
ncbi:Aste57867_15971 [Aphanomyces stellatus]|uniref:Aste57867_15971 protein n=1 Tax=Aphanomyces stellatus TaxID=120398 RepID=A0A485L4C5_9STRA|nr:hypothetical protein As57867_015915 [Aphanomyces stellatus]VFT92756.1 Aste57867_15971 [Aphanomyces stellatus]